jgi:hypothetical protein
MAPKCETGSKLVLTSKRPKGHVFEGKPYFRVAGAGFHNCEEEGAYPAVNVKNGTVYVAYEYNWATNIFTGNCFGFRAQTKDVLTRTPLSCLTMTQVAACGRPAQVMKQAVTSIDALSVPGYTRFPVSDFPRLAVSSQFGVVSMVWNDALPALRRHPAAERRPTRSSGSGKLSCWTSARRRPFMLPGLQVANAQGLLDVGWYSGNRTGTANRRPRWRHRRQPDDNAAQHSDHQRESRTGLTTPRTSTTSATTPTPSSRRPALAYVEHMYFQSDGPDQCPAIRHTWRGLTRSVSWTAGRPQISSRVPRRPPAPGAAPRTRHRAQRLSFPRLVSADIGSSRASGPDDRRALIERYYQTYDNDDQ